MPEFRVTDALLTGRDESTLVMTDEGHRLQAQAAAAFKALQSDAAAAGFELAIASSYRSFERQCLIWNGKACGERTVHDDEGVTLILADMLPEQQFRRFCVSPLCRVRLAITGGQTSTSMMPRQCLRVTPYS